MSHSTQTADPASQEAVVTARQKTARTPGKKSRKKHTARFSLGAKGRSFWVRWHTYISCFFLPLVLLYVISGFLYLLGFEGGAASSEKIDIQLTQEQQANFPQDEQAARQLFTQFYSEKLPQLYYHSDHLLSFWDIHHEVMMTEPEADGHAHIIVETNDWMRQLIYIHKGLAGELFRWLGIMLALSLVFSIISGVLVALAVPKMKATAIRWISIGTVVVVLAYLVARF
ncbi:MAG: PepSY domain-containing protein [Saccharospirillaceae bacterium]|jgi:hypothetical protein|nr:PepSY domain-containing protein [Saccharospirillaceae bacterium]